MKTKLLFYLIIFLISISCNKKKLTEVVVPLPEEKHIETVALESPDSLLYDSNLKYELTKLSFKYNSFEPDIKGVTMKLHYAKIFLNCTNNFNKIAKQFGIDNKPAEEIVRVLDVSNENLKFTAGGYYNHKLFFESFTNKKITLLDGDFKTAFETEFESVENFKTLFKTEANAVLGSGWVWLILDQTNKLHIVTSKNEDNPLMHNAEIKGTPLLGIDLWEHAYINENQINKNQYIDRLLSNINWDIVMQRYAAAVK